MSRGLSRLAFCSGHGGTPPRRCLGPCAVLVQQAWELGMCCGAWMSPVYEQASHGSDEPLCAPGDGGQLHEPMCQRATVSLVVQLFFGDRPPQSIDDCGRIVVDLLDRAVEVFCP